jgi:hypothetical protein
MNNLYLTYSRWYVSTHRCHQLYKMHDSNDVDTYCGKLKKWEEHLLIVCLMCAVISLTNDMHSKRNKLTNSKQLITEYHYKYYTVQYQAHMIQNLFKWDAACKKFDHISGTYNDVRIKRLTSCAYSHATRYDIQFCNNALQKQAT